MNPNANYLTATDRQVAGREWLGISHPSLSTIFHAERAKIFVVFFLVVPVRQIIYCSIKTTMDWVQDYDVYDDVPAKRIFKYNDATPLSTTVVRVEPGNKVEFYFFFFLRPKNGVK